jgi:hypothetical protein
LSPASVRGNGAARASPPVLGRPHECSQLVGGSGTNAGGTSNIHHYMDNETPICQVCIPCFNKMSNSINDHTELWLLMV